MHSKTLETWKSRLLDRKGRERYLRHASVTLWPWRLTSWPPKLVISSPCPVYHLCQSAAKSVHSFSKYRVHDGRTGWKQLCLCAQSAGGCITTPWATKTRHLYFTISFWKMHNGRGLSSMQLKSQKQFRRGTVFGCLCVWFYFCYFVTLYNYIQETLYIAVQVPTASFR